MTTAFGLVAKVLSFRVPPRALVWGLLNTINRSLRTGNRRFEFERLYLEHPDPWSYKTSAYELGKYRHALAVAEKWRRSARNALEIGCSVGVFSRMLAQRFDRVTAVDFSKEALDDAIRGSRAAKNLRFAQRALQSLDLGERFDVIFCAEVLYYLDDRDVPVVCRRLAEHLAEGGVIVFVSGDPQDRWPGILAGRFEQLFEEEVEDAMRPYRVAVFTSRRS
jgi:2-polyprenyl-3-methyl-5-hydroxy-6-metoxy-1,4-benzoquinol methylase